MTAAFIMLNGFISAAPVMWKNATHIQSPELLTYDSDHQRLSAQNNHCVLILLLTHGAARHTSRTDPSFWPMKLFLPSRSSHKTSLLFWSVIAKSSESFFWRFDHIAWMIISRFMRNSRHRTSLPKWKREEKKYQQCADFQNARFSQFYTNSYCTTRWKWGRREINHLRIKHQLTEPATANAKKCSGFPVQTF